MEKIRIISELVKKTNTKIVFLVIDGVGGIRTVEQHQTELELAKTPNLDALAAKSICGRSLPAGFGITPGSGPGHLALFGYDPLKPEHNIGRGVLEVLGIDFEILPDDICARGNFAVKNPDGTIADRRAGRLSTERCIQLCNKIQESLDKIEGVTVIIKPVKEYRFALIIRGENLSPALADTDPQQVGLKPLDPIPTENTESAKYTAEIVKKVIKAIEDVLEKESDTNTALLRGFSKDPCLPKMQEIYKLTPAAIATYPLYRGVARLLGMDVFRPQDETISAEMKLLKDLYDKYDFFFIHVKKTDSYGEDGNRESKIKVIEEVDAELPKILELNPDVLVVTGDHSTPTQIKGHSWHPVPLMIYSPYCDVDDVKEFNESACDRGGLGIIPATEIMPLALANAGKLMKYGA